MIDYDKIAAAVQQYRQLGYHYIAVPWVIQREPYQATAPESAWPFFTLGGFLPASGEQSFLQLLLDGKLAAGRYCCVTPCYRDEVYDTLHLPYFFKVELIEVGTRDYVQVKEHARTFFNHYCSVSEELISATQTDLVETKTGIELGSYGWREYRDFTWSYGTGVAEPRLSQVLLRAKSA